MARARGIPRYLGWIHSRCRIAPVGRPSSWCARVLGASRKRARCSSMRSVRQRGAGEVPGAAAAPARRSGV